MQSLRRRIRRDFAPLTVSVSLEVVSTGSPATQVFDEASNEFDPDRSVTPTVIIPRVSARANDGSWDNNTGNEVLAEVQWYVGETLITEAEGWTETDDYEIIYEGANAGQITIKKNIVSNEVVSLRFKAVIPDKRFGNNIPVVSDPIILSTFVKGLGGWSIEIGNNTTFQYNPFLDRLFRYQYQVAHGITPVEKSETEATDGNSYIQKFPITVHTAQKDSYDITVYRNIDQSEEVTETDDEVIEKSKDSITLDLRLIEKADYYVVLRSGMKERCRAQFAISRVYPPFKMIPANGTSINEGDKYYYNVVMVTSNGNIVQNPESIIKILWETDTASKKGVVHNEGVTTSIRLSDTGIGDNATNGWLDIYTDGEQKPAHVVATDKEGNEYTDGENGEILIFN